MGKFFRGVFLVGIVAVFISIFQGGHNNNPALAYEGSSDSTLKLIVEGMGIITRNKAILREYAETLYGHGLPLEGKTYLVTGTTSGLGSGIAGHLAALGASQILPVRKLKPDFESEIAKMAKTLRKKYDNTGNLIDVSNPDIKTVIMDLSDFQSIDTAVEQLHNDGVKVDVLINNAGLINPNGYLSKQGVELTMGVNFLGTAYFTKRLLDLGIIDSSDGPSRIISISSEEHRMAKSFNTTEPLQQLSTGSVVDTMDRYAFSKLAQTTYFTGLARKLPKEKIVVNDMCPGPVASNIASNGLPGIGNLIAFIMKYTTPSPEVAALPVLRLADAPEYAKFTGQHFHIAEPRPARADARDETFQNWLDQELADISSQHNHQQRRGV
uniref:Ketoreductase (KR) domain-containing protein n=1 Tax=Aplanochytrium stocchinoi TaxID=215587 RepID=A0A7S3PGD2_9STRA|mmetsp:Transcript_51/g.87  ORF Transcript_51/g.87 Transcript_51/m.87 type:complete len:382 (+) Transcript_51:97-1242(+)|eukprot:CAMPEP_0204861636 /NCGR_PEP_ID=MMETSP1348-20121228/1777_1 /ASSEMBLY_ACC=CAM_ASM_000700 /TAXON_ID=215587 /ORGANISM="Aplanochytrium stocchinoi, Strain GSBS06" /LENGTH=381 /DNA_ID=CAMNT_0052011153 /DNA_START=85 /DNA_END=1230 /DNA_ORIENTATION=+